MSAVIRARGLELAWGRRPVLSGAGLDVEPGERWCILGPNGSGKSTLLRAILGELRPRAGTLELGEPVRDRARLGFVPQSCELGPWLPVSVREFVGLGLVGARCPRRERRARVAEGIDRMGLGGLERAGYRTLSGGQKQRALVARALVRRPDVLLADEPTTGLDLPAGEALLDTLCRLAREDGLTLILVLHDIGAALRHGERYALCSRGSLITGGPEEVLTAERLEAAYGVPLDVRRAADGSTAVVPRHGGEA